MSKTQRFYRNQRQEANPGAKRKHDRNVFLAHNRARSMYSPGMPKFIGPVFPSQQGRFMAVFRGIAQAMHDRLTRGKEANVGKC